jgi:hypothetical protein
VVGYVTNVQVLATDLVNPATNDCYCCFVHFVVKVNVNVIIQHHSLGSLSCPGTDVYTWSTYMQSPFFSVLHILKLVFFDHLPYV